MGAHTRRSGRAASRRSGHGRRRAPGPPPGPAASSTARARVDYLLDPGSFRELGTLVGDVPADAIVAGSGQIDGRPVMVGAEDFTVVAGTIGGGSNAKRFRLAELALQERVPLIMILEGAGYRPTERSHGRSPTDLLMQARCSGRIPVITARARPVSRPRRPHRPDVGLHGHE